MKLMFLLMSVMTAMSTSLYLTAYMTGDILFREKEEKAEVEKKATAAEVSKDEQKVTSFKDKKQRANIDQLIEALEYEKSTYAKKVQEFKSREDELANKEEVIAALKASLEDVQKKLKLRVIELETAERENFKQLALFYSKMAPENAATLLQKMEISRAAKVINLITDRKAAAILDAAVTEGAQGTASAADWSDAIRRITVEKNEG